MHPSLVLIATAVDLRKTQTHSGRREKVHEEEGERGRKRERD